PDPAPSSRGARPRPPRSLISSRSCFAPPTSVARRKCEPWAALAVRRTRRRCPRLSWAPVGGGRVRRAFRCRRLLLRRWVFRPWGSRMCGGSCRGELASEHRLLRCPRQASPTALPAGPLRPQPQVQLPQKSQGCSAASGEFGL
ncbi:hypothetical protein U0070_015328, partial [Myodes glareolus]